MIKASAPGKLMLFGEHSVVYDEPCIVTSVDHRISVSLEKTNDENIVFNAPDLGLENYIISLSDLNKPYPKKANFVLRSIFNFFERYGVKCGLKIKTESEFSSKFGLGSSSAVTVATISALLKLLEIESSKKEIFDLAYKTVIDVQGVGSGFDIASAVYGKTLYFVKGGKVINSLEVDEIPLLIGYTGIKADTTSLVNMVFKKLEQNPGKINNIFKEISKIVNLARNAMENKDWQVVGELMNLNQNFLRNLGVSSKELERLIEIALNSGAYGAKLSGAGGGDCMIALIEEKKREIIEKAIERAGGQIINVKVSAQGVRIE